jgi:tryptophan halogenase
VEQQIVRDVVILGGGTAGWMTAAALSRVLNGKVNLTLVESDEIGIVGVGEATIPGITRFNALLEIDEDEFLRETQGTFKLGIEFVDWDRLGDRYMHGFGRFRDDIKVASFEQVWQRMNLNRRARDLTEYSITKMAAYAGKFQRPRLDVPDSPLADIAYAFHFDASLYAKYLRRYAEKRGAKRVEGKVVGVSRHANGDLKALQLASGKEIAGQFFIDCSGFRGRLIEEEFKAGYDDWSHWLPCDRAVAVPCASAGRLLPYTRATARSAGWQWRIPLQHRIGNGYVFASPYLSEDEATATLLAHLDGEALAAPRTLKFVTGVRRKAWHRNCVAIGLSSGFLEPLESTSIHLIQSSISRLLSFFPGPVVSEVDVDEYNRLSYREFEHIRDFVMLHYHATHRDDSPLWNHCRTMSIPDSLRRKIELFKSHGRLFSELDELFAHGSWFQVMQGQGLRPRSYSTVADVVEANDVHEFFEGIRVAILGCLDIMPTHEAFIERHCKAPAKAM